MRFWIGARGADMGADGRGIIAMTAGEADSPIASGALADRGLAVDAPSPTWLAPHPRLDVVYAALEGAGEVAAYRRTGEATLEPLCAPVAVGKAVCHVAVAPDGSRVIASCWGDGRVVHVPLSADGRLREPAPARPAADPYSLGDAAPEWTLGAASASRTACAESDALAVVGETAPDDGKEAPNGLLLPGADRVAGLLDGPADAAVAASGLADAALGGTDIAGALERAARFARGDDDGRRDSGSESPWHGGAAGGAPGPDADGTTADGSGAASSARSGPGGSRRGSDSSRIPEPRPSRAHAAAFLPDGRVATTDLGYDLIRIWRLTPSGLVPDHDVVLPFGVGPRHMFAHPSGHLHIVTEFSCEVWTLRQGADGRWQVVEAMPTGAQRGDTGAELTAGHDRRFLYAGVRGSDAISVLRVAGEGERLQPVALVESGVRTPRHHVVVRDALLVAGQRSNEVVSLSVDTRTGVPGAAHRRLETPTPQHVLPTR